MSKPDIAGMSTKDLVWALHTEDINGTWALDIANELEARVAGLELSRDEWREKYIGARQSGFAEGRSEERAAVVGSARATADLVAFDARLARALRTFADAVERGEHEP
jgi:hypothetical protein